MKKTIFLLLLIFSAGASARKGTQQPEAKFVQLLQMHQQAVNAFFTQTPSVYSGFEKAFFADISFTNDVQIENSLRQMAVAYQRNGSMGQSYATYTRVVWINGYHRSVSLSLANDGQNIRLIRSTNDNGVLLKTAYDFDLKTGKMNADLQQNQKQLLNKEYSL